VRRTIVRRLLGLLILALATGTLVPAASAMAGAKPPTTSSLQRFGVRLVDVPVSEAHNPRGLRYIIDYLPAGAVIHRRILVKNEGSRTAHFTVYPDTARIGHGYFVGDAGETRSELTTWIRIAHPRLTLHPGQSALDMVTIRVPRKPTRGEHYGVIWAQQVGHVRTQSGFMVRDVARVGIRIYLAVGPGGVPPTNFAIGSITGYRSRDGRLVIAAQVHNTGGRAVDLGGTVRLTDGPGGSSAGPYPISRIVSLAPGQSNPVYFVPGRRLPSGPWRAAITLQSGFTTRTASATILFSAHLASATWARPAMWATGLTIVVLAGGLLFTRRVRQTRRVTI
jgi:hypothetical protein